MCDTTDDTIVTAVYQAAVDALQAAKARIQELGFNDEFKVTIEVRYSDSICTLGGSCYGVTPKD